jgi:hypothetical protein
MQHYDGLEIPENTGYWSSSSTDYINSRNNYRYNPYHRLDVGISFHKKKKHGIRTWNISVYNAYNQLNPFMVYPTSTWTYDRINNTYTERKMLKQISLFPIIPSLSYSYKF